MLARFNFGMAAGSPGALAKELFLWAVVLALGVFAVDQAFYWTKPGQLERARSTWASIAAFAHKAGRGARSLADRAIGAMERRRIIRGRR